MPKSSDSSHIAPSTYARLSLISKPSPKRGPIKKPLWKSVGHSTYQNTRLNLLPNNPWAVWPGNHFFITWRLSFLTQKWDKYQGYSKINYKVLHVSALFTVKCGAASASQSALRHLTYVPGQPMPGAASLYESQLRPANARSGQSLWRPCQEPQLHSSINSIFSVILYFLGWYRRSSSLLSFSRYIFF